MTDPLLPSDSTASYGSGLHDVRSSPNAHPLPQPHRSPWPIAWRMGYYEEGHVVQDFGPELALSLSLSTCVM